MNDFFELVLAVPFFRWIMVGYLTLAIGGGLMLSRFCRQHPGCFHHVRFRYLLALYLGLVLTPSVLTDWFLFRVPAPAFVGFLAVAPGILFSDQRFPILLATGLYHLAPIAGMSLLFFGALTLYSRCRAHHPNRTNVA